jgi:hypothetical protein
VTVNDGHGGGNYAITYADNTTSTIKPATLVYVADPVTKQVGQPDPVFTGTVTGLVNGDTLGTVASGTIQFTSPATDTSPAGSYPIVGSGLTLDSDNYILVQAPAGASPALTVSGFPVGQPNAPFSNFSAQFNANAGYTNLFTQSWFPSDEATVNGWLIPVFSPGNEPHPVYSDRRPVCSKGQPPPHVIAFGSSLAMNSAEGAH